MSEQFNNNFMMVDDMPIPIEGEKNLLEIIRKAGIELPTFCYYSELSVYGACRMCMVENKWGSMEAACSTPPRAGMEIYTNTPKLRKYRKMILELLLSNHCRDCTTCEKSGKCRLQELAARFDIHKVRFENTSAKHKTDDSTLCITRDASKCILCGDCVRVCNEVQHVGAIEFAHRGSKMTVSTAFDLPLATSNCVGCGQCAAVCPTAAIIVKNDAHRLWNELNNKDNLVVAQIAPAVRTAVAESFNYKGENVMGKIVACLRKIGIDKVFDTSTAADLTVLEEAKEFLERIEKNENIPLFTSCCPAWVKFCENKYPELLPNVSTCRSPMQMFASIINEEYKDCGKRLVSVAIMPCTAKKAEAAREEFRTADGKQMVDYVITTQELIRMIREAGIVFEDIEPEAIDMPYGTISGAGVIFGVTGGVTEAVIRYVAEDKSASSLRAIALDGPRGLDGIKEFSLLAKDKVLKIAVVSGLSNADEIISRIKNGEHFDLVEVMACPNGCINGAGQPVTSKDGKQKRSKELYNSDKLSVLKSSQDNPLMKEFYEGVLKGRVHELLHVHYAK
ncbi:MAG: (2Fe-2S)-binding protein [Oscillospiraceae bacterium]|nr:(2Fe-2S)-binding protein [Oscillospiraceae bacterium]